MGAKGGLGGSTLRWGHPESRYVAGIALLISGAVSLQSANTYALHFLLLGSVAHIMGWVVLPGPGVRRAWVAVPSLLACWALLTGPQSLPALVVPLVAWLVVRRHPLLSFVSVLPLLAVTLMLANQYRELSDLPLAYAVSAAVLVGSAWLGYALAQWRQRRAPVADRLQRTG
ncbi:MAG TPA: hypothetical protein VGP24_16070 [Glaciihabitans sp.]|nr:hypothetical protein [Glaciihabitans sp.]